MEVYGLIGNPVGHSLSPPMHEAAYDALDIDARYVTFEPPTDSLGAAIAGADTLGVSGLNVTIPFKQAALELVEPDDLAARIGALNTIDFSGDSITGHNTDAAGLRRAFEHHEIRVADRRAVVVGAGGAGRAATFALDGMGASVAVANRTVDRARELAAELEGVSAHSLDEVGELVANADVLVNATSVGMEEDRSPVPASAHHADLVVFDAVYTPLETRLLREAAAAGATTIDGAWMLLYQGAAAFERWTGRDAPVESMNAALRAAL